MGLHHRPLAKKVAIVHTKLWEEKKDERTCKTDNTHKLQMPSLYLQCFKVKAGTQVCQQQCRCYKIQRA